VISGSAQLNSSIDEGVAFLEVEAKDPAGNVSGEIVSQGFVLIDNKIPTPFQVATECPTIGPCTETSRVVVEFSEPIKGAFLPVEFQVGGHVVTGLTTTCSTTTRCNKLTLSVTPALMPDERPQVTYTHIGAPVVRPRAQDDALNALSDFAVQAQDGVAPPLPSLDAVTQDGVDQAGGPIVNARSELTTGFHTNQERPTFSLSGLPIEGEGGIADDVDGSGDYEPTIDNVIVRCDADLAGSSACTPPPSTWSADGEYLLLAMAWDKNGTVSRGAGPNLGVRGDGFTLTIDNIAPSATGFSPTGTDLLVNFTEVIEYGPNRAADWNPIARVDEDTWRWISITRVTGTGDSRTLDVEDDDYVPGTATKVFFSMEGDAPDRPQDRAGNYLLNQTVLPH
jgi:hypothetical protein